MISATRHGCSYHRRHHYPVGRGFLATNDVALCNDPGEAMVVGEERGQHCTRCGARGHGEEPENAVPLPVTGAAPFQC